MLYDYEYIFGSFDFTVSEPRMHVSYKTNSFFLTQNHHGYLSEWQIDTQHKHSHLQSN